MAYYTNINPSSALSGVEFFPRAEGNFAFFYAKSEKDAERLKPELAELGQQVLNTAAIDGQRVLITEGAKPQKDLADALEAKSERLRPYEAGMQFHPWKWRGHFSDVGQGLNFASSLRKAQAAGTGLDTPKLMFAALNLTANWVNKEFGAQKRDDPYQLKFLKEKINAELKPHLPDGVVLPAVEDNRAELRKGQQREPTAGEKFHSFMKRNSVRIGEIGLRYLGSIFMVFDITELKKMGKIDPLTRKEIAGEAFKWERAFSAMKNESWRKGFGLLNKDKTNLYTGAIYLTGKSIGLLFAKAPDPYNPKPHTALDTFREKYAFRISSMIETGAAATLAVGSFRGKMNKETGVRGKGDIIGGLGGTSLVGGLTTRYFAPFGVREVNRDELYAHTVDALAAMPRDQVPALLAKTAALLKNHFKDKPETYGQIFTDLRNKLYKEHGIAIYADEVCKVPQLEPESHRARLQTPATSFVGKLDQSPPQTLGVA